MIGNTQTLTRNPMAQADVYRMIKRRTADAGIKTAIGCHTFRATGITAYLKNGVKLEVASSWLPTNQPEPRGCTIGEGMKVTVHEVERITI